MESSRPSSPEIPGLTAMRGIAAVHVVLYHTAKLVDPEWGGRRELGLLQCGYLAVDFFFLLSGFVLTHVYARQFANGFRVTTYRDFLSARLARIYPLHFFVLGLWIILEFFRPHPFGDPERGWSPLILTVLLVQDWLPGCSLEWNLPSWSISAEWAVYLAFPLLIVVQRLRRPAARAGGAAMLWLLLFGFTRLVPWGPYRNGQLDVAPGGTGVVRCALEFSLGIVTYGAYADRSLRPWLSGDAALLLVCAFVLATMQMRLRDTFILPAFPLLILCVAYNTGRGAQILRARPLRFLGDISYSVYLLHLWLREIVKMTTPRLVERPLWVVLSPGERVAFLAAFLGVVIALSAVTFRYVELPMRVRLRDVLGRRPAGRTEVPAVAPDPSP